MAIAASLPVFRGHGRAESVNPETGLRDKKRGHAPRPPRGRGPGPAARPGGPARAGPTSRRSVPGGAPPGLRDASQGEASVGRGHAAGGIDRRHLLGASRREVPAGRSRLGRAGRSRSINARRDAAQVTFQGPSGVGGTHPCCPRRSGLHSRACGRCGWASREWPALRPSLSTRHSETSAGAWTTTSTPQTRSAGAAARSWRSRCWSRDFSWARSSSYCVGSDDVRCN